ncbi:MAG: PsbP-related protein [Candidatus Helarchaeota archaeon]
MKWNEYTNSGIKFKYPANWHIKDKNLGVEQMIVLVSEEPLDTVCDGESTELIRNINFAAEVINLEDEKYSKFKEKPIKILEKYVSEKVRIIEANIKDFKLIKKENTLIHGYLATILIYTGEYLANTLKWQQHFIVVDKDLISTITATALETAFNEEFEKMVSDMLDSIELYP